MCEPRDVEKSGAVWRGEDVIAVCGQERCGGDVLFDKNFAVF